MRLVDSPIKQDAFARTIAKRLGVTPEAIESMDFGDLLILSNFFQAVKGKNPAFLREFLDRADGKVPTTILDMNGPEEMMRVVKEVFGDDPRVRSLEERFAGRAAPVRVEVDLGDY